MIRIVIIHKKSNWYLTFKSAPAQNTLGTELEIITTLAEESSLIVSHVCFRPLSSSVPIAFLAPGLFKLTSIIPVNHNGKYFKLTTNISKSKQNKHMSKHQNQSRRVAEVWPIQRKRIPEWEFYGSGTDEVGSNFLLKLTSLAMDEKVYTNRFWISSCNAQPQILLESLWWPCLIKQIWAARLKERDGVGKFDQSDLILS